MGYQIIKQPNGLLAVFVSYTDSWVVAEATPEEVSDYFAEMAAEESRKNTARILENVMNGEPRRVYAQFALSFDEANDEHNMRHPKVFAKGEFTGFPEEEK